MSDNYLLDIVKQNKDLEELLTRERDYDLLYHFSKIRSNILRWYEFEPKSRILEVGGGCGTITNYLCRHSQEVVCVEKNSKYKEVNRYRNSEFTSLHFADEKLNEMEAESYDYVVMIQSLCYAKQYVEQGGKYDAYQQILIEAKRLMRKDGSLLIALPNKYGIKYLAGAVDELTGNRFSGMNDYQDNSVCRSFSKEKIEDMLKIAGFEKISFYYPVPDYLFPVEIYSDSYLPKKGTFYEKSPNYLADQVVLFDESIALNMICEDGLFTRFANSYLIVCQ